MEMFLQGVPPLLSPEEMISGMPIISSPQFRPHLTMEIGLSSLSDSPLGYLLANLGPLHLMPDLNP
jgi:hypothetical protein